jgi:hypothetical protein
VLVAAEIVRLQDNHEPAAAWDHQCTNELRVADAAIATAPNLVVANIVGTVVASDLVVV